MGPMEIKRLQITLYCTRNYIITVYLQMIHLTIILRGRARYEIIESLISSTRGGGVWTLFGSQLFTQVDVFIYAYQEMAYCCVSNSLFSAIAVTGIDKHEK